MRSNKQRAVTIYDIARETGYTAATVSRALNNKGQVSQKVKEIIIQKAKELDYSPNPAAKSLKTRKTNQIMLSIPHMSNAFYFDMIAAVQSIAKSHGYSLLLNYTEDSEEEELKTLRKLKENLIDGLILISINFTEKHLKEIRSIRHPVVLSCIGLNRIKSKERFFDYVGVDTCKGVYLAAEHLLKQGHTKIGYVGLPLNTQTGDERYEGYCQAMRQWGLEVNDKYVITGGYTESFGYKAGMTFIESGDLPTAICTTCDHIALGLYAAFDEKGIRIPDDVAIVGMDNIDITTKVKPKMSTVAIASAEIGRTSAELIFSRLNGSDEPYKNIVFEPRLVVRESSVNVKEL